MTLKWYSGHATEAELQKAVTEYLAIREAQRDLLWSVTDPAAKEARERGRRVRPGWSDITVCVRGGRFVGIELKRPRGGRTSPKQVAFREAIIKLGGIAVECRSVAEVHRAIEGAIK